MDNLRLFEQLNHPNQEVRLKELEMLVDNKSLNSSSTSFSDVNNHIHTWYSFSPYSPTKAVAMAIRAGLGTAGIMDHDSVAGVKEFIQAGRIADFPVTSGVELRVSMKNTSVSGRRINNPDQDDIAYIALHGIPYDRLSDAEQFCRTVSRHREIRNRRMTERINELTAKHVGPLDYDKDVLPLSKAREGGSVTERHLLFALSERILSVYGRGKNTLRFLTDTLKIPVSRKNTAYLEDPDNPYYPYDLLGALKSDLVEKFYIPADENECPDVAAVIDLAERIGAISAYAYLGDVYDSITGDKKAQKFEDDYLNELFGELKRLGFRAVTYMPSRNTPLKLQRIKILCNAFDFMEISGEDINSPRQNFICEALRSSELQNLVYSTYALIQHEYAAAQDRTLALFSTETIAKYPDLNQRIRLYARQFLDRHKKGGTLC
jgi:hypothetical protein